MTKKITNVKGLHVGLPFQEKLLLKGDAFLSRDLLAMKLLGIDKRFLARIENKSGMKADRLKSKKHPNKNIYKLLQKTDKDIEVYSPEEFKPPVTESVIPVNLTSTWLKDTVKTKDGNKQIKFTLENSDELENIAKRTLNYEGDDKCLNIVILFPIKEFSESENNNDVKLCWNIYEQIFNGDVDRQLALLMAIQILTHDKIDEVTCFNIVKNTIFENNFTGFNLTEEYIDDKKNKERYMVALNGSPKEIIHTTVDDNRGKFSKIKFVNLSRDKIENNKITNKKSISNALKNHTLSVENLSGEGLTVKSVDKVKKETGNTRSQRGFESAAFGLRLLMSQVPGVLCHIKIPFNSGFPGANDVSHREKDKSDTWILGPESWIDLLKKPPEKLESKSVFYNIGYAIHRADFLIDEPKKPKRKSKKKSKKQSD